MESERFLVLLPPSSFPGLLSETWSMCFWVFWGDCLFCFYSLYSIDIDYF